MHKLLRSNAGVIDGLDPEVPVAIADQQPGATHKPMVILRCRQAVARTGKSRADFYACQNPKDPRFDPTFPVRVMLSPHGRSVGWIESEIDAWIAARVAASRAAAGRS
jgi:prophage regulatory protein